MITAREVRLVGSKGEQLGVMPLSQAQEMARKQNLDLVEVAPMAVPPVCRILDYGKFRYEQAKKEHDARKSQKIVLLREMRMRPKIGDHDFEAKARIVRKLLADGDKVKVTVMFRGREITHPDLGWKLLQRMAEKLGDVAAMEKQPVLLGKHMHIILSPVAPAKVKAKREEAPEETEEATVKESQDAKA
ncbi:MAG: translation initiation factor IF-3 [Chloroflexi bacterium]|nr:translation initiation factor IF-3 [Chloroflexota bacterium]